MKILLLKDKTINNTLLGQVELQLKTAYKGLDLEFVVEDVDYTDYPIEPYWGGYYGLGRKYIQDKCAEIYKRWAEELDSVVFLIASDNWKLDREDLVGQAKVWGWNMSNQFSSYGVQQVRFAQVRNHTDQRNVNNSAGTLYHELMHDHDTYVFVNTGKTVEPIVNVPSWDNSIVHGEHPDWAYIRTVQDNVRALTLILPTLIEARNARKIAFLTKKVGWLQTIQRLMMQLRALQASVRGDLAVLPNNKCSCCRK